MLKGFKIYSTLGASQKYLKGIYVLLLTIESKRMILMSLHLFLSFFKHI